MKVVKLLLAALLLTSIAAVLLPGRSEAYQAMMSKAKKFGATDCLFCHVYEDGGEGWNERGTWLMEEKRRRKAEKVDPDWLADYKPDESQEKPKEEKKEKPQRSTSD